MKKKKIIRAVTVSESLIFYTPTNQTLKSSGYELILVSSPGHELEEIKNSGMRTASIPMKRHISIIKDVVSLLRLIILFARERPDMVHSMTPKAGMLCMLAAWLTRVPRRVHTFTGLVWPTITGIKRRILMFTDWITCFCATHIIPEGEGVKSDLQAHITTKSMKVLGYGNVKGVDMERFSHRPEVDKAATKIKKDGIFTFIFVGRIVGDKGINELMAAFVRLLKINKKVRLILVGKYEENLDPIKPETLDIIKNTPQIEAVGSKYGDDLLAYYSASDCFVFPSYREGFPNTVMEAGAMGLPCIVTDINGSREIIENGKNGVIIPSKDTNALYVAMKNMIEDKEAYKTMVGYARPMIESRFEQDFVRSCLLDFYEEVMK